MKNNEGFSIFEIKATKTVSSNLFKEMDRFEEVVAPIEVNKTLIYGGSENEKRTKYRVLSWKNSTD
jgi:hypothetical protein